jgi:uncharacterized protein (DUF1501 family)
LDARFPLPLGGFDTHGAQLGTQDPLLQKLSQAVAAFYKATQEVGADSVTTTFTASEFGRTLIEARRFARFAC